MPTPPDRTAPWLTRRRAVLALALLGLLTTSVVALRVEPLDLEQSCCDMLYYRSMAYNLVRVTRPELNTPPPAIDLQKVYDDRYFGRYYKAENRLNRQPPYVYRPAAPMLARALTSLPGIDIERAFRSIAFLSLWTTAFVTGLTVLSISGSLIAGASAVATISALYRITAYHFWNSTMADPLALALLALAVWLLFQRRDNWLLAVALLGLFTKETFALVLASFVLLLVVERRLGPRILLSLGSVVAIYMAYRLIVPIPNNSLTFSNAYLGPPGFTETIDIAFAVFGSLSVFACARLWSSRHALILSPLIAGVFLLAMLTPDRERLFIYAFPALFVAAFAHPVRSRITLGAVVAPALLTFAYTQRDVLLPDLTHREWIALSFVVAILVEPVFIVASRLWEQSPVVRLSSRLAA